MSPKEYLDVVVRPNIAELNADTGDIRAAFNAIASVDALGARIYWWGVSHEPRLVEPLERGDDDYRQKLERINTVYHLISDVARAIKHIELRASTSRLVYSASGILPESVDWDAAEEFDRDYSEFPCVVIRTEHGAVLARNVLERAMEFLERHMVEIGISE